jgi:endogenous inhibitor of DNA gyrase (YacG/DUF329 family)
MIQVRCPTCAKRLEISSISDLPTFPFCSDRCRLVDLGRWIDGAYAIPTGEKPADPQPAVDSEADERE